DRRSDDRADNDRTRASAPVATPIQRHPAECRVSPLHSPPTLNASLQIERQVAPFGLAPINALRPERPDGVVSRRAGRPAVAQVFPARAVPSSENRIKQRYRLSFS